MSAADKDLRPSPRHKPVSLFVTCIVDMIYPGTGVSVVEILDHLGIEVRFPLNRRAAANRPSTAAFRPMPAPSPGSS